MTRHTAVVAGTHVVLAAGATLLLAPAITQQLWTDRLVLPVLAAALLPTYLALTLVPRPPRRTVTNVPAGRAEAPASTVSTPGRPGASTAPPCTPAGATSLAPAGTPDGAP